MEFTNILVSMGRPVTRLV